MGYIYRQGISGDKLRGVFRRVSWGSGNPKILDKSKNNRLS